VRNWLENAYPELRGKVSGGDYPTPPTVELLLKIMAAIQMLGIVFVVLGDNLFTLIGMQRAPSWYHNFVVKNHMPIMIGVYLVIPQILNGYAVSGAFEIILNGKDVIYSKLATGQMPKTDDLIASLTKAGLTLVTEA
jgi:hypothetical protein